ncbi:MAG: NAD(P)-binding protein [Roseobacter sp.]|jgi:hypothetical protein
MSKPRIAVIGAGIAGLRLAQLLSVRANVQLFDKSRGPGGRMSTRRAEEFRFDHGAQYFTAHGIAFQTFLRPFIADGTVERWTPRLASLGGEGKAPVWSAPRYVALPGMNGLCKAMAQGLQVSLQNRIARIERHPDGDWTLTNEQGGSCGRFDWVISTAPAEQSARLMPAIFSRKKVLDGARMTACYSLMLGGLDTTDLPWDAAVVQDSPIAWIAINSSKPGRSGAPSILCQSRNDWAEQHLEDAPEDVQAALIGAFQDATGLSPDDASHISLHKWRFAKVEKAADEPFLLDAENRLAAAGDWCGAGRVEAAFDSATALGEHVLEFIIQ